MKTTRKKKIAAHSRKETATKKNKKEEFPGYLKYPASEDIYVKGKRTDKKIEEDDQPPTNLSEKEPGPPKTDIEDVNLNVDNTITNNNKKDAASDNV